MRFSLHPGVWSNTLSLVLAGSGAVTVATATQSGLLHLGQAGVVAGVGLLMWGIRIDDEQWWLKIWRRWTRSKLPPTMYVRNTDAKSPHFDDKSLRITWVEKDLSLTFRGEGSDGLDEPPILEPTMTFELFNAGDETARHVIARWRLPGVDLTEDVALMGPNICSFQNGKLKMKSDQGAASIQPVALQAEGAPIPAIRSGEVAPLRAPSAFTTAYSIRALGRAKRQAMRDQGEDANDPLAQLERWGEPMDRAFVDLTYAVHGAICRHSFAIVGRVWGGSPPHVRSYDTESGHVAYQHTPGTVAVVDYVGVVHVENK